MTRNLILIIDDDVVSSRCLLFYANGVLPNVKQLRKAKDGTEAVIMLNKVQSAFGGGSPWQEVPDTRACNIEAVEFITVFHFKPGAEWSPLVACFGENLGDLEEGRL